MNYSNITTVLANALSSNARVCTRYNYTVETETHPDVGLINYRRCKIVAVDVDQTDVSFTVRAMQFTADGTVVPSPAFVMEEMRKDPAIGDSIKEFTNIQDAVEYTGLNQKYTRHFEDLLLLVHASAVIGSNVIITAANLEKKKGIALFVQDKEMALVIQLLE